MFRRSRSFKLLHESVKMLPFYLTTQLSPTVKEAPYQFLGESCPLLSPGLGRRLQYDLFGSHGFSDELKLDLLHHPSGNSMFSFQPILRAFSQRQAYITFITARVHLLTFHPCGRYLNCFHPHGQVKDWNFIPKLWIT